MLSICNGKLPNGYHEVQTILQQTDIDSTEVEISIREDDNQFVLTTENPKLKTESTAPDLSSCKTFTEKANNQVGANDSTR